MLLDRCDLHR